jgi:hypothetical protein
VRRELRQEADLPREVGSEHTRNDLAEVHLVHSLPVEVGAVDELDDGAVCEIDGWNIL